jgi:hypothetical protein
MVAPGLGTTNILLLLLLLLLPVSEFLASANMLHILTKSISISPKPTYFNQIQSIQSKTNVFRPKPLQSVQNKLISTKSSPVSLNVVFYICSVGESLTRLRAAGLSRVPAFNHKNHPCAVTFGALRFTTELLKKGSLFSVLTWWMSCRFGVEN